MPTSGHISSLYILSVRSLFRSAVEDLATKIEGSSGVVVHEFISEGFKD